MFDVCGRKDVGFSKRIGGKRGLCVLWALQGGTVIHVEVGTSDVNSVVRGVDEIGSFDGHLGVVEMYEVVLSFIVHFDLVVVGGINTSTVVDFGEVEEGGLEISVIVVGTSSVCIVVVSMLSVIGESEGVVVSGLSVVVTAVV